MENFEVPEGSELDKLKEASVVRAKQLFGVLTCDPTKGKILFYYLLSLFLFLVDVVFLQYILLNWLIDWLMLSFFLSLYFYPFILAVSQHWIRKQTQRALPLHPPSFHIRRILCLHVRALWQRKRRQRDTFRLPFPVFFGPMLGFIGYQESGNWCRFPQSFGEAVCFTRSDVFYGVGKDGYTIAGRYPRYKEEGTC